MSPSKALWLEDTNKSYESSYMNLLGGSSVNVPDKNPPIYVFPPGVLFLVSDIWYFWIFGGQLGFFEFLCRTHLFLGHEIAILKDGAALPWVGVSISTGKEIFSSKSVVIRSPKSLWDRENKSSIWFLRYGIRACHLRSYMEMNLVPVGSEVLTMPLHWSISVRSVPKSSRSKE